MVVAACVGGIWAAPARGELPAPLKDSELAEFPMTWTPDAPGAFDAASLLDKPAGRMGFVVSKDGHFYTGDKRIRFWGVNICFGGCFPTHEAADRVASRLAHFGINAVRFHHMDNQKFPNGIFGDDKLETLSDEAMDRLDYFISALKKNGVYADLNLHVSRSWGKAHGMPNIDKLPQSYDKFIDLFDFDLIAANKKYARDLLTHVNKYTGNAYASEPAVGLVEINNENTFFIWGGDAAIAKLPEPYVNLLNKLWNQWLMKKYETREKLREAWKVGELPLGENLLADSTFATLTDPKARPAKWVIEQHEGAKMTVSADRGGDVAGVKLAISAISPTSWHLQLSHPGLKLKKGQFYTLSFQARADSARPLSVGIAQAHAPWQNLGLSATLNLKEGLYEAYRLGFVAADDDENGRVSFSVGHKTGEVMLANVMLQPGGQEGLAADENPYSRFRSARPDAKQIASHKPGDSVTPARAADWYAFLQQTDEAYWTDMRDYLRNELKVNAPITGTIGLGPLGTLSQSKMDYVDAHAYWEHPHFPGRPWDPTNWVINNKPMVDNPDGATLWRLAAIRVAGKPFTVTEYNHSAPNEWQAEGIPMIATYAATQDWDGVFLFAYSHGSQFEREYNGSYFDIEGNPLKMLAMPVGARIFLGQKVKPSGMPLMVPCRMASMLEDAPQSYFDAWSFARRVHGNDWKKALNGRMYLVFEGDPGAKFNNDLVIGNMITGPILNWSAGKPGTGRFALNDPAAAVLVGFAGGEGPPALGDIQVTDLQTPFAAMTLTPADSGKTIKNADRLLLCAMARAANTGMGWNEKRTSVSNHWGKAPTRIEPVKATLTLPADFTVRALDSTGKVIKEWQTENKILKIGEVATVWYELIRK